MKKLDLASELYDLSIKAGILNSSIDKTKWANNEASRLSEQELTFYKYYVREIISMNEG